MTKKSLKINIEDLVKDLDNNLDTKIIEAVILYKGNLMHIKSYFVYEGKRKLWFVCLECKQPAGVLHFYESGRQVCSRCLKKQKNHS